MAKFVCSICGFTHEGFSAPEKCPICMAPSSKFSKIQESRTAEDEMEGKGDSSIGESATKAKNADNELGNTREEENLSDKNELIHEENLLDSVTENSLVKKEQQDQESQLDSDEDNLVGGSGCVVTIMVAITSTLSLTWLLLY